MNCWTNFYKQHRHMPLAILLCLVYIACMLLFTSTFYNGGLSALAPFIGIWVALGIGIFMCVLSFWLVDCHVPDTWIQIKTWEEFRDNLLTVELPNHYSYYGPTSTVRKYTHHLIITDFELIYPAGINGINDHGYAIDAKIYCKEYIDSYFPKLWYQRSRVICCCNMKRCCCFGWVGAGQIQRRDYLASEILKKRGIIMNVRENGDMPHSSAEDRWRRLQQRNGEPFWDLMLNNCEHYANWIMTGEHYAVQIATGPFWELYFLNSVGRVILGTMQNAIITVLFRIAFVILFIWANAVQYEQTKLIYWIITYTIVAYNATYVITDIAKVTHLKRSFGNGAFCYPCYSDYADNKPAGKSFAIASNEDGIQGNKTISNSVINLKNNVFPHEGLKMNSEYSMPIISCIFKSVYLFLMSTAALLGGSWIGQGPTVQDTLIPDINCLPIAELVMSTVTTLGVYTFWYPLMASSLDFFLWHKPQKILSAAVYILFAVSLILWLIEIIHAGYLLGQSENLFIAQNAISAC